MNRFMNGPLKLSREGAAALVGNFMYEDPGLVTGLLGGYKGRPQGIAQWLGVRKDRLNKMIASGMDPAEAEARLVEMEVLENKIAPGLLDQLRTSGDVDNKALAVRDRFESPGPETDAVTMNRIGNARRLSGKVKTINMSAGPRADSPDDPEIASLLNAISTTGNTQLFGQSMTALETEFGVNNGNPMLKELAALIARFGYELLAIAMHGVPGMSFDMIQPGPIK
jgi:hypothetical protein